MPASTSPSIPSPVDDFLILRRALLTLAVRWNVQGFLRRASRDDVPAGAAAEISSEVNKRTSYSVPCRSSKPFRSSDPAGDSCNGGQPSDRLEPEAPSVADIVPPMPSHREKDGIELVGFSPLRYFLITSSAFLRGN
ncbi:MULTISPECIES: hypothetical protein [unclassified Bradyrhizobium]